MSTTEIRPATAADFDVWLPLWKGYQDFYRVDIADAVTRNTWDRLLDPTEPMHVALAYDGKAIGMVHWIFHRSTWTAGDYCYLQDLYVTPEARGTGAGRKLIEHVCPGRRQQRRARVLADPRDQRHRHAAVRPHRRPFRLHPISQGAAVTRIRVPRIPATIRRKAP